MNELIYIIILCIVMSFAGAFTTKEAMVSYYEHEAVSHQAAHYDPQTSKFTWNPPEQK